MLVSVDTQQAIQEIPHRSDFDRWMENLDRADYVAIQEEMNRQIDEEGHAEIVTSSWMPGADWTNTPYQPIYLACNQNVEHAGWFFGLLLWEVMMDRHEAWAFGRYPRQAGEVIGLTYFRVQVPALSQ